MATFVFIHAHPDDESIFTGGTIALLAERGHRCVVVVATSGDVDSADRAAGSMAETRAGETERACAAIGATRCEFLGYTDSGIDAHRVSPPGTAFVVADVDNAAARLVDLLGDEHVDALVYYDEGGIYAHGDHLMAHRVGRRAAELASIATVYECTVDREYLHFVDTHLVEDATMSLHHDDHGAMSPGVPTVLLSTTVDVRSTLPRKRAAIAAHASQLPPDAPIWQLDDDTFAAVYGYEWYIRTGPPTPLDTLPTP